MSIPLITRFGADPLLDLEIANKRYVDRQGTGSFQIKIKESDLPSLTEDTTLQDDPELFVPLLANKKYFFIMHLAISSDVTPDFKFAFSFPSGGIVSSMSQSTWRNSGTLNGLVSLATVQTGTINGTAKKHHDTSGFMLTGATAGNLQLQWAQNTSSTDPTEVRIGSSLLVWEI